MMRNVRVLVCLTALVSLLVVLDALPVSATESRMAGMGQVGAYTHDDTNIFYFPGSVGRYERLAIGELRTKRVDRTYSVGLNHGLGESGVVGIHLNRPSEAYIPEDAASFLDEAMFNRTTDLLYGMETGSMDLGFRLGVSMDGYSDQRSDPRSPGNSTEYKESTRGLHLGAGLSSDVTDVGAHVVLPAAKIEFAGAETKWGGVQLMAGGRMFLGENERIRPVVVGMLNLSSTKRETDDGVAVSPDPETTYGLLGLMAGVGAELKLDSSNLLVVGLDLLNVHRARREYDDGSSLLRNDYEATTTTTVLPALRLGLESRIARWLTGRLGAVQTYSTTKTETDYDDPNDLDLETSRRDMSFETTFGLGINLGRFVLDAVFNEGLLFDGPNVVSGTSEPISSKLSLTYTFGKD